MVKWNYEPDKAPIYQHCTVSALIAGVPTVYETAYRMQSNYWKFIRPGTNIHAYIPGDVYAVLLYNIPEPAPYPQAENNEGYIV